MILPTREGYRYVPDDGAMLLGLPAGHRRWRWHVTPTATPARNPWARLLPRRRMGFRPRRRAFCWGRRPGRGATGRTLARSGTCSTSHGDGRRTGVHTPPGDSLSLSIPRVLRGFTICLDCHGKAAATSYILTAGKAYSSRISRRIPSESPRNSESVARSVARAFAGNNERASPLLDHAAEKGCQRNS